MTDPTEPYARLRRARRARKPVTFRNRWASVRYRSADVFADVRAVLSGYCNHCPWTPEPGVGGYVHWRCGLPRGHDGMHRANNYVWTDDGQTDYLPVPIGRWEAVHRQPWERSGNPSWSQARRQRRWNTDAKDRSSSGGAA